MRNSLKLKFIDNNTYTRRDFLKDLKKIRDEGTVAGVTPQYINDSIKKSRKTKQ